MLFWTPDITHHFHYWLNSGWERIVCCQIEPWNGVSSCEFEARLSETADCSCISLAADGEDVDSIIFLIWQWVSSNQSVVDEFISKSVEFRRSSLREKLNLGMQPDLGIYDCVDLLSLVDTAIVLCIRITDSVPTYLTHWVEYITRRTRVKVIVLHPKKLRRMSQLKHFNRIVLPVLSKICTTQACESAIYRLTGTHITSSELETAYSYSDCLNEFISLMQEATVRQCSVLTLLRGEVESYD